MKNRDFWWFWATIFEISARQKFSIQSQLRKGAVGCSEKMRNLLRGVWGGSFSPWRLASKLSACTYSLLVSGRQSKTTFWENSRAKFVLVNISVVFYERPWRISLGPEKCEIRRDLYAVRIPIDWPFSFLSPPPYNASPFFNPFLFDLIWPPLPGPTIGATGGTWGGEERDETKFQTTWRSL